MKLYILRHGDAVEHGDPRYKENERPLTAKGVQRTKQLAHALREMEVSFDAILTSPFVRAKQTADIVARGLRLEQKVKACGDLTPSGDMRELVHAVNTIRPTPKAVLLVGHEPFLSGFISLLCSGGLNLPVVMKKGALCRMDVELLVCGKCAVLEWLVQPRITGLAAQSRKGD